MNHGFINHTIKMQKGVLSVSLVNSLQRNYCE